MRAPTSGYAAQTNIEDPETVARVVAATDMWHIFETHLQTGNTRKGKRYKDWLFARIGQANGPALETIEGGASLLMRDVVRRQLQREFARRGTVCFTDDDAAELQADQLLATPSPADETARREYEELAARHAVTAFGQMSHRERIALLCREVGLALSHPLAQQAAGCRKTTLHSTYLAFHEKMARAMKASYPEDDPESVLGLTLMLIHAIKGRVTEWAEADASCSQLLGQVGKS